MACSVPVVATRCGGPEQILDDGINGLLVDVGSSQQIAAAVERVRLDPPFRKTIVAQALVKARSKFSLERTVLAYDSLYSAILDEVAS
jgi:glycosyltransferase involved in cell wall biosynthesis